MLCNGEEIPQKLPLTMGGSGPPSTTWLLGRTAHAKCHVDRASRLFGAHGPLSLYFTMSDEVLVWLSSGAKYKQLAYG